MAASGGDRFRFSGLEMAVIAASFVVTAVLVFILGFYVGRDVASRHLGPGPLTARVPVGPAEENGGLVHQPRSCRFPRPRSRSRTLLRTGTTVVIPCR